MILVASALFLYTTSFTSRVSSHSIAKHPNTDEHHIASLIDSLGQSRVLPPSQGAAARRIISNRLISLCSKTVRVSFVTYEDVRKAMCRFGYRNISPKRNDYSLTIDSFCLLQSLKSDRECLRETLEDVAEFHFDHPQRSVRAEHLILPNWGRRIYGLEYRWGKYQYILGLTNHGYKTEISEIIIR